MNSKTFGAVKRAGKSVEARAGPNSNIQTQCYAKGGLTRFLS